MQTSLSFDAQTHPLYDPKQERKTLRLIAGTEHDLEWYPTTPEMLRPVLDDIVGESVERCLKGDTSNYLEPFSMLDICAGSGSVFTIMQQLWLEHYEKIKHISSIDRYQNIISGKFAIEKAMPLIEAMDKAITILATDFNETTLIDKSGFEYAYMNPPYSDFEAMTAKAVREARCHKLYVCIPVRWEGSQMIQEAIKARRADVEVLGEFDFQHAEVRKARAKVHVVKIELGYSKHRFHGNVSLKVDPFDAWLDDEFPVLKGSSVSSYAVANIEKEKVQENVKGALVKGGNLIEALEQLFKKDMANLMKNYKSINELDPDLLQEMNVDVKNLKSAIKSRIKGLKNLYWEELFANYSKITTRLTSSKRKYLLDRLSKRSNIDFTLQNALAVTIWVLKQATDDVDQQLLDVYGSMVNEISVVNFKSNQRVFSKNEWGWRKKPENLTHFRLSYRFVVDSMGGIDTGSSSWDKERFCGLSELCFDFVSDVLVIARNLGFESIQSVNESEWLPGKAKRFTYFDTNGKEQLICEFKAHLNGNTHIRLGKDFGIALNIEHGRLKGWVNSAQEAAEEMEVKPEQAAQYFNCQFDVKQIKVNQFLLGSI